MERSKSTPNSVLMVSKPTSLMMLAMSSREAAVLGRSMAVHSRPRSRSFVALICV